ncbi:MAG: DUF624 domain-containing protein [Eubacteriales bacterium]|nr:DUF624 domain-containing protein [Eubacteriales bacterium]
MAENKNKNENNDKESNGDNKIFSFFSPSKNKKDKGITKKQAYFNGKYDFFNFFSFLKFRFGDITRISLLFILINFSLLLILFTFTGYTNNTITTPSSPLYQQVYGMLQYDNSSATVLSYAGVYGVTMNISVWTIWTKILIYSGYSLIITFGLSNVGMAYLTRGFIRRNHLFIWHDFWYSIKKNFKQGLIVGVLDIGICYLLYNALLFYGANRVTYYLQLFFYLTIAFTAIYLIMRMYFYLLLITFDLKLTKLIKNAFIFSLLGIKRNICAVLGIALTVLINVYIFMFLPSVGVLIPFLFTIGLIYFIAAYCVFPVIDTYMIKPYYKPESDGDAKPVFTDRG